ncbi:sigma-70 family RNA polymerase sigma factor [uncultured Propionivibrio sp.]|uniref:sigma-70 family RNA polymerase sigma factor n=1 Tax=uncultured Propionivibrio sp. TaxID=426737 RepID=UPI0029BFE053|nr:sigma-70 family RNA polymerase sigma factor [uncultured Propionivibrio sp.]
MSNAVYIVDDDASVRDSLGLMLGLRGYQTVVFADAASFLTAVRPDWLGCLILDIRMPGMNGLELQRELRERGCSLPVVIITGHGDVNSAREAFRSNAIDFLEKPLNESRLLEAIDESFAQQSVIAQSKQERDRFTHRLAQLTPREYEVMELIITGRHNREIAEDLGISPRTVEVHKARIMDKLEADNIPQLVRFCLEAGTKR